MCELEVQNREENLLPFTPALLMSQKYPVLTDLTFKTTRKGALSERNINCASIHLFLYEFWDFA